MLHNGLNLKGHVAQPLSSHLARHADLILTMTNGHREAIVAQWPSTADRVHVLGTDQLDISDPIGGSLAVYRKCAQQIEDQLRERLGPLRLRDFSLG
jgi:protein-tyrosine phosphatase